MTKMLMFGNPLHGRGFTLLEMMLVMAILGMAVAVIAPRIGSGQVALLKSQVREAVSMLKYARRTAIIQGHPMSVEFYSQTDNTDSAQTAPAHKQPGQWVSRGAELIWNGQNGELPDDSTEKANHSIMFYPEGGSSGGHMTLVHNGLKATVSVDELTGQIKTTLDNDEDNNAAQ